jgi:hypothetical protein
LVGLRQYGSDYDDSSEDARRDEVPNSSSGDDAHDNADPDSADDRAVKKIRAEDLYSSDDCNQSDSSSLHTPAQKSKRAQPFTPPKFQKDYDVRHRIRNRMTVTIYFLVLRRGASADSSVSARNGTM